MTNYDINQRSMFAAYHIRTGSIDGVKLLSILSFGMSINFERGFSRNIPHMHRNVIECFRLTVDTALEEEIKHQVPLDSIEYENMFLTLKLSKNERNRNNIAIPLTVSYDMGWSKGLLNESTSLYPVVTF